MTSSDSDRARQEVAHGRTPPTKRGAVLDAAIELFLASGFDGTSMDAVAAHAGVSKTTVYAHFGDKVELFRAVTERGGASLDLDLDLDEAMHASDTPEERLSQIVLKVLEATTATHFLAFQRVMVTEAIRRPELVKIVQSLGVPHVVELLARALREDAKQHAYVLPSSSAYAGMILRAAATMHQVDALLAPGTQPDTAALQSQARWLSTVFLRALRDRRSPLPAVPDASPGVVPGLPRSSPLH